MPTRSLAVVLRGAPFALTIALIFGACSSSAPDERAVEFTKTYQAVTSDFTDRTKEIQERAQLVSGQGLDQVLGVYQQILDTTSEAHEELATLEPSDDFASVHEEMVEVLDAQVQTLTQLVEAAEERDVDEVTSAARLLTELKADWESLQQEMEELITACAERCG